MFSGTAGLLNPLIKGKIDWDQNNAFDIGDTDNKPNAIYCTTLVASSIDTLGPTLTLQPNGGDISIGNNTLYLANISQISGSGITITGAINCTGITTGGITCDSGITFNNSSISGYIPLSLNQFEIYSMTTTATGPFTTPVACTFTFIRIGSGSGAACFVAWTDVFGACSTAAAILITLRNRRATRGTSSN